MAVDAQAHEEGLARFILSPHRPRFLESLRNARLRRKLRDQLAHFSWLDRRYSVDAGPVDDAALTQRLRALGAPDVCFVLSEDETLDGLSMPLDEAVQRALWSDSGALISCIPAKLALYADEARLDVTILAADRT